MTSPQRSLIDILARQAVNEYLSKQRGSKNSEAHRQPDGEQIKGFGDSDQIGSLSASRIGHTVAA